MAKHWNMELKGLPKMKNFHAFWRKRETELVRNEVILQFVICLIAVGILLQTGRMRALFWTSMQFCCKHHPSSHVIGQCSTFISVLASVEMICNWCRAEKFPYHISLSWETVKQQRLSCEFCKLFYFAWIIPFNLCEFLDDIKCVYSCSV